jgi:hypothetical protein
LSLAKFCKNAAVTATSPAAWAYDFGTVFCIALAKKCAMIGLASASPAFYVCIAKPKK